MRRTKALIVGALLPLAVGLSACGAEQAHQVVQAANVEQTPTLDPEHQQINDQLGRIENKVDNLRTTVTKTKTKTVTAEPTATKTVTKTVTPPPPPTTTPPTTTTTTTTTTPPPDGTQTLGVGGVATPTDAKDLPAADSKGKRKITTAGVYDCKGATVGYVEIDVANTTLQNCKVAPNSNYGIWVSADNVTVQNNDIAHLKAPGDINAITAFGNNIKIKFNTFVNGVDGDPGDSHTDFIQTWVSTSHPTASSNWEIRGNKATGPANPSRKNSIPSIHQVIMVEDFGRGGNSGGSSAGMKNWLVVGNEFGASWNQDVKNDGVDNFVLTKNNFVGSSDHVMEQASGNGLKFFSDNQVGSGYGNVGVPITAGAGPN